MTLLNENFSKELQRMAKLAGVQTNPLNENITETHTEPSKEELETIEIISENKAILTEMPLGDEDNNEDNNEDENGDNEDDDDIFGDTGVEIKKFTTPEKPTGDLDKDLKAAMVLNNVSEYEAALLDLYTKYNPMTKGAKPEVEGGEQGTVYAKSPAQKLPGGSREINRLSYKKLGIEQDMIDKLEAEGTHTPEEIERIVAGEMAKLRRAPLSFDEAPGLKRDARTKDSLAKWQPTRKNASIISYVNGTLTNRGKQQLEFLSRMLSKRPLRPNGDENIDIEQALFDTIYVQAIVDNAEDIIRDFYNKALVPILSRRLKRNIISPKDAQFDRLKTAGIDHAIDMTRDGKYNASGEYQNYGAWFLTTAIHKAIDGLKPISDLRVDFKNASDMLSAYDVESNGPFKVKSKLSPEKAIGGYNDVSEGSYKTKDGELVPYFIYSYNEPLNVLHDLEVGGKEIEDGKKSPLSPDFLIEKGKFYVSTPKYVPPTQDFVNPTFDENIAVIPGDAFLKFASEKVNSVLDRIASQMTLDAYNGKGNVPEGEEVRISRNVDNYPTFTKGQYYKVVSKEKMPPPTGGPAKNYYKLIDNNGDEQLVSSYDTMAKKAIDPKVVAKLRDTKKSTVEILRMMLQYGDVMELYSKAAYFYNPKESNPDKQWTRVDSGGKVKINPKTGEEIIPFKIKGDAKSQYKSREEIPTIWKWIALTSGEKGTKEVNLQIIDELSALAKERNLDLSPDYFDVDKNPKYKKNPKLLPNTIQYLNTIRKKLKDYFEEGAQQSKADLSNLLKYYVKSEEAVAKGLAENHIRKAVREMLAARLSNKILNNIK